MTRQEFFEIAGYFANPVRKVRIELEARESIISKFAPIYFGKTGIHFPFGADSITTLPDNANKWGREMRLYFSLTNHLTIPTLLDHLKTGGGRFGYDDWSNRLNNRDLIDDLLEIGFTLGGPQDEVRIRGLIPASDLNDFNKGFNLG